MTGTVGHAETGTRGWRSAARTIQAARLDHDAMYALGAELSESLRAMEQVARVLAGQVTVYGDDKVVRDGEGADPHIRLHEAGAVLADVQGRLRVADVAVQRYQSAIGHIGLADMPATNETEGLS